MKICNGCGMIEGNKDVDAELWDTYHRISDGRATWEPLVYTMEEYQESYDDDGETNFAMLAMEQDMVRRGLCPTCGRPDLRNITEDQILSDEDLKEMQDMWAEEAAERRTGC
jgi:hypothetical protein